jgi:glutamate-5-semialdehyde dehydrogenase
VIPLVILRGSGASTARLVARAAANGVRTLAHAEGGGVLYAHAAASLERLERILRASLDRLGVCNRLNLALIDRDARELARVVERVCRDLGIEVRGTQTHPLDRPLEHEWASEPERVATITLALVGGLDEAVTIANQQTSGLAAAIMTEDGQAAERFLDSYRGTAAYWNATTRFTDGFELLGTPEIGINVDRFPGPRGPVSYRDLCLRQYRIVGDGSQTR